MLGGVVFGDVVGYGDGVVFLGCYGVCVVECYFEVFEYFVLFLGGD